MNKPSNHFIIENVNKTFGSHQALTDVTMTAEKGELIALIGPSGAGKSTLLNLITKVMKPDSGRIVIGGENVFEITNRKEFGKKVGVLRQQFDLVRNINVVNNVLIGRFNEWGFWKSFLSLFKPRDLELAEKALTDVGLEDKLYHPTALLSGGEQQRAAIARLLVQNPELYLADEPISSLDPANSRNILSLLTDLVRSENKTLIASMHSVEFAREYFDRIIGLKSGKIIFDYKTSDVSDEMLKDLYRMKTDE